jgi:hypothetical protein
MELEFVPMYRDSMLEARGTEHALLIARLKICAGRPEDLYYLVGDKDMPIAIIDSNEPLPLITYYGLIYKRMEQRANGTLEPKKPMTHPLCIQSLEPGPRSISESGLANRIL